MQDEAERPAIEAQEQAQRNYERALRRLRWVLGSLGVVSIAAMVVGGMLMSPDKDKKSGEVPPARAWPVRAG